MEQPAADDLSADLSPPAAALVHRAMRRAMRAMLRQGGMTPRDVRRRLNQTYRREAQQIGVSAVPLRALHLAERLGLAESGPEERTWTGPDGLTVAKEVQVWHLTEAGRAQASGDVLSDPAKRRSAARRRAHEEQSGQAPPRPGRNSAL